MIGRVRWRPLLYVSYRTDPTVRLLHITPMPRYSFTLEDGVPRAALAHLRVVVRNKTGGEDGDGALQFDLR